MLVYLSAMGLTVFVQDQDVEDPYALVPFVRIWSPFPIDPSSRLGFYIEGPPSLDLIGFGPECRGNCLRVLFPERDLHPGAQAKVAKELARKAFASKVTIGTHSLTVLFALNNYLLGHPALPVEAFALDREGNLRPIVNDRFIDESVLGKPVDELGIEMNRLLNLQGPKG